MTREDAIKRLEDTFEAWEGWVRKCPQDAPASLLNEALGMAISALREQPRWISVEERLPEEDRDVLCWYEYFRYGNYNRLYQTYGIGYCINGHWGGEVSRGTKCKVLAWMPLPEPPEVEV